MRTFFAIALPEVQIDRLLEWLIPLKTRLEEQLLENSLHWVRPPSFHITLQFLAEVREEDIAKLCAAAEEVLQRQKAFALEFGGVEWFPNSNRPRVLSLQVGPEQRLAELSGLLGKAIERCGYETERRSFRGHLTLGRVYGLHRLGAELLEGGGVSGLGELWVEKVVLFHSEPDRGKGAYTALREFGLE